MVRGICTIHSACNCFPHARGDGPIPRVAVKLPNKFSPRPWGWSAIEAWNNRATEVFPTPVGMVRSLISPSMPAISFPHARGDGPYQLHHGGMDDTFSPRPWGWSAEASQSAHRFSVFPTPVGMVLFNNESGSPLKSFPHARGDGPVVSAISDRRMPFSPRPWGWFAGIVNLEKRQR